MELAALILNAIAVAFLVARLNALIERIDRVLSMFGKQPNDPRYKTKRLP